MRALRMWSRSLIVLALSVGARLLPAQSAQELFQQAVVAERASGKLADAIALYQRVIREAGTDRALAARALVRTGATYEMLGRTEARAAYDRVIREFGDQPRMVAQARDRLAALRLGAARPANGTASVAQEVWSGADVAAMSRPSPDGRYLAFVHFPSFDVAVRDLERDTTIRLTNTESARDYAEFPVFSADGKQIAFAWFNANREYELRTIAAAGGPGRSIPIPTRERIYPYGWTPSGDGILAMLPATDTANDLAIVKLDGTVVKLAKMDLSWDAWADISPDGRWVVFDRGDEGALRDIYIVAGDGSSERVLVRHSANDWRPMWTPDGKSIAFLSDRSGTNVLWAVDVANGVARGAPRVLKGDIGESLPIGFARNGTLFYFPHVPSMDILVTDIDIDSLRLGEKPHPITESFSGMNAMPDWSSDGKSLLFTTLRGSIGERLLVTINTETKERRELVLPFSRWGSLRWSDDARRILLSGNEGGSMVNQYFTFDLETRQVVRLTSFLPKTHARMRAVRWSADYRSILFAQRDSGNRASLHRMTPETGVDELLYAASGNSSIDSWTPSPDGRWIAISSSENAGTPDSTRGIKLLAREDGRVIRTLPAAHTCCTSLNWSPDSKYLIGIALAPGYTLQQNGRNIWRVPIDGSPPTKFDGGIQFVTAMNLSRDGKRVVFLAQDPSRVPTPAIWAIERFVPGASSQDRRR